MKERPGEITKLSDLQEEIQKALQGSFARPRWITAEISELKENFSGHCYLDLVEKDEGSDKLLARARATIWSSAYRMLKPYFETTTGYRLESGIRIMVSANVEYHPVYGLSLNIKDIDPSYTLGDVERKRQEIIRQLEEEGVMEMNREVLLPSVPQKIAVISSSTAAGYEDFLDHLLDNPYGYKFYVKLFPAVMQGEKAESSVIQCLEKIFEHEGFFDLVAIIRGGGSKSDLACFDSYDLAYHVSQFPLPVLTGIGHEQDDTITDLVAHTRLKTPTAVAGFLIDRLTEFESVLDQYSEILIRESRQILHENEMQLKLYHQTISAGAKAFLSERSEHLIRLLSRSRYSIQENISGHRLSMLRITERLKNSSRFLTEGKKRDLKNAGNKLKLQTGILVRNEKNRLANYNKLKSYAEPSQILKLGFSITRLEGKALRDPVKLEKGDLIETELSRGKFNSEVTDLEKKVYIRKTKESQADK